jgi:hypothetical protein
MRRFPLLSISICLSLCANTQNSPHAIFGKLKDRLVSISLFYQLDSKCELDYGHFKFVTSNTYLIIGDSGCVKKPKGWYVVFYNDNSYLVDKRYFEDTLRINRVVSEANKAQPDFTERYITNGTYYKELIADLQKREDLEKQIELVLEKKYEDSLSKADSIDKENRMAVARRRNIIIIDFSWSYPNEYSSFADVSITVLNPFKKKIKYISFSLQAFNPVDDLVKDGFTGASTKIVKGVGPINYGESGSYEFESVLYSKVIETMKIKSLTLLFFDGSTKTISNPIILNKD